MTWRTLKKVPARAPMLSAYFISSIIVAEHVFNRNSAALIPAAGRSERTRLRYREYEVNISVYSGVPESGSVWCAIAEYDDEQAMSLYRIDNPPTVSF
jgi:hypothetical protein